VRASGRGERGEASSAVIVAGATEDGWFCDSRRPLAVDAAALSALFSISRRRPPNMATPARSKQRGPTQPAISSAPHLQEQTKRAPAIDEYLAQASPRNRALLEELRKTIRALVPEVEECISYRIPAFRFQGRIIAGFSATSTGCSYYPFSGTTLKTLASEIEGYSQTKSALHFGPDRPLPTSLVRKLLKARIAEGSRRGPERKPA
jgi:uncharacterized protein YdhG (YjbR/CyaY superfamily)